MQIRRKLTNLRVPGFRFFILPRTLRLVPRSLRRCHLVAKLTNAPLTARSPAFPPVAPPSPLSSVYSPLFSGEKPPQKLAKMHNGCILKAQVNLHLFFTFIFSGGTYEKFSLALALFLGFGAFNAQAFDLTEAANKMADGINNTAQAIEDKKAEQEAAAEARKQEAAQAKAEREAKAEQAKADLKAKLEAKKPKPRLRLTLPKPNGNKPPPNARQNRKSRKKPCKMPKTA